MPYTVYEGDDDHPFYVRFEGVVSGTVIVEALHALVASPTWQPGMTVLWDGRNIAELLVEVSEFHRVREVANSLAENRGGGRGAIVASRDLVHLVAQSFIVSVRFPPGRVRVFKTIPAALSWLERAALPPAAQAAFEDVPGKNE